LVARNHFRRQHCLGGNQLFVFRQILPISRCFDENGLDVGLRFFVVNEKLYHQVSLFDQTDIFRGVLEEMQKGINRLLSCET
jgi:hypothetical protein